jgi:hypothetical protein
MGCGMDFILPNMVLKIEATGEECTLLHHGFNIAVIELTNGEQKTVHPREIGLTKKKRPK